MALTLADVMAELERLGTEQTRKTFARHGAPAGRQFGVKVADLKTIQKRIKGQQQLALDLYATGNSDAQYLAGLVADGRKMSREELQAWAEGAAWTMQSDFTVPWVASESPHGPELARTWIESDRELVASAGWSTWSALVATRPDEQLDLAELAGLLERVARDLDGAQNRVRYAMNGFVIAAGSYVAPLTDLAKSVAARIGTVRVDMGETACKVPPAGPALAQKEAMGRIGKKRKTAKC